MKLKPGSVVKRGGLWWVVDDEGYDVSYISHDFKKDAVEALKVWRLDMEKEGKGK